MHRATLMSRCVTDPGENACVARCPDEMASSGTNIVDEQTRGKQKQKALSPNPIFALFGRSPLVKCGWGAGLGPAHAVMLWQVAGFQSSAERLSYLGRRVFIIDVRNTACYQGGSEH